jgi:septal ring factor EnvC (AmiA/AmiB activator)
LVADAELTQQLQDRTKQMEEQEAMIKTLNKQLSHCETDLQTHMNMVNNLETSLGDSEKNRNFSSYAGCTSLTFAFSSKSSHAGYRACS